MHITTTISSGPHNPTVRQAASANGRTTRSDNEKQKDAMTQQQKSPVSGVRHQSRAEEREINKAQQLIYAAAKLAGAAPSRTHVAASTQGSYKPPTWVSARPDADVFLSIESRGLVSPQINLYAAKNPCGVVHNAKTEPVIAEALDGRYDHKSVALGEKLLADAAAKIKARAVV